MSLASSVVDSPLGELKLIASDKGLVAVLWENDDSERVRLDDRLEEKKHPILVKAARQLGEYFAGKRKSFTVPLDLRGTQFQRDVWEALLAIPFGETRSYGDLARGLGNARAARAVGAASGRNPISIMVPCHRLISSTGKLTGFAGGLAAKSRLIKLEQKRTRGKQG